MFFFTKMQQPPCGRRLKCRCRRQGRVQRLLRFYERGTSPCFYRTMFRCTVRAQNIVSAYAPSVWLRLDSRLAANTKRAVLSHSQSEARRDGTLMICFFFSPIRSSPIRGDFFLSRRTSENAQTCTSPQKPIFKTRRPTFYFFFSAQAASTLFLLNLNKCFWSNPSFIRRRQWCCTKFRRSSTGSVVDLLRHVSTTVRMYTHKHPS